MFSVIETHSDSSRAVHGDGVCEPTREGQNECISREGPCTSKTSTRRGQIYNPANDIVSFPGGISTGIRKIATR